MLESLIILFACFGGGFGLQHKVGPAMRRWFRIDEDSKGLRGVINALLSCAFCSGFWGGVLVWLLSSSWMPTVGGHSVGSALIYGLAAAAFYYVFDVVVQLAEAHLPDFEDDESA